MNLLKYAEDKLDEATRNGRLDNIAYWGGYCDGVRRAAMTPQSAIDILRNANFDAQLRAAADMAIEALEREMGGNDGTLTYNSGKQRGIKGIDGTPCDEVCEERLLAGCGNCPIQNTFDRLAAYEDTGLEPEEIMSLINPPNPPLTLEELREMVGEPVWVKYQYAPNGGFLGIFQCMITHKDGREFARFKDSFVMLCSNYGDTWLAYRHKKEVK